MGGNMKTHIIKMNKKAQATDTPIILGILVFQAFIIICLGFLTMYNNEVKTSDNGSDLINFKINIITNIKAFGWGNTLIFAPLEICIVYIIAKLVRGG